jgi:hypothetical protein
VVTSIRERKGERKKGKKARRGKKKEKIIRMYYPRGWGP